MDKLKALYDKASWLYGYIRPAVTWFGRKVIDNPDKAAIAVALFLISFFVMRSCEASEGRIEVGPAYSSGFNGGVGLVYTERFGRWDIGAILIGEQTFHGQTIGNNGGFMVQRVVSYGPFELGLGGAYFVTTSKPLLGSNAEFALSARYYLNDRWSLTWRHWSNAGIAPPNRGQDVLMIGYGF